MGVFIESVRASRVRQPTQRGFSPAGWAEAFGRLTPHDEEDDGIFEAGRWYFAKFEAIRNELRTCPLPETSRGETIRLVVGMTNADCQRIQRRPRRLADGATLWAEELAQTRDVQLADGVENADVVLDQYMEGASRVIRGVMQSSERPWPAQIDELKGINSIEHQISLGALYDIFEDYWAHTLWNGWRLRHEGDVSVIAAPIGEGATEIAVSDYCRDLRNAQETLQAIAAWRAMPPSAQEAMAQRLRVGFVGYGKHRQYRLERVRTEHGSLPFEAVMRGVSYRPYHAGFTDVPLPRLPGATLETLLSVWDLLFALSEAHIERFPAFRQARKFKTLRDCAPVIAESTLCDLVTQCVSGVSRITASGIVRFLTVDGGKDADLWTTPLVRVDEDHLTWLVAGVTVGNLLRSSETWLRMAGVDVNEKGAAFERLVRAQVGQSAQRSARLRNCGAHPEQVIIRAGGEEEQVDIVLWIGRTLLVGEAKCVRFPADPVELHGYYQVLDEAAGQAERKAAFVREHAQEVGRQLRLTDVPLHFVPFVLTNQPHGVGFPRKGVPIVDLDGLRSYIEHGCQHCGVQFHIEDGVTGPAYARDYYATEAEAEAGIRSHLMKPPEIADYERTVQLSTYELPLIGDSDTKTALERPEVRLKMDAGKVVPLESKN